MFVSITLQLIKTDFRLETFESDKNSKNITLKLNRFFCFFVEKYFYIA